MRVTLSRALLTCIVMLGTLLLTALSNTHAVQGASGCWRGSGIIGAPYSGPIYRYYVTYPFVQALGDVVAVTITWSGGGTIVLGIEGGAASYFRGSSPVSGVVTYSRDAAEAGHFFVTSYDWAMLQPFEYSLSLNGGCDQQSSPDSPTSAAINDGRVNANPGSPLALYCIEGGVQVYLIGTDGRGTLGLNATAQAIAEVSETPSTNTLILSESGIDLYRLNTGEMQVNYGPYGDGQEYVYIWTTCAPNSGKDASFRVQ